METALTSADEKVLPAGAAELELTGLLVEEYFIGDFDEALFKGVTH
jgi:hypothetical protein